MPPVNRRPAYRTSPPLPPLWLPPERPIDPVPLAQFVLLSMLLHALAITLFGAPAGGSREGRAMWGSLEVTLLGPPREAPAVPRVEREARVRPAPPRPPPPAPPKPAPPAPPAEPVPVPDAAAPPTLEPLAFPPLLDRLAPGERPLDLPELKVPLPAEVPKPAPPTPIPAPIEPITPRVLPTPMEIPAIPVPVPAAPLVPQPPPVAAPLPQPAPRAPAARVEPIPLEPIPAPIEPLAPRVLPTPLEAPALPATPPVERVPLEVPAIPVPRADAIVPRSESAPASAAGQPEVRDTPAPPAPQPQPRAPASPAERAPAAAPRIPAEAPSPFRAPPAARPGADSTYDPTAPSLDTDALRRRAGQLGREGSGNRALLPFPMPAPPEKKGKMETAIENARKPDCRKAYADLGLLAVVPLIANEFGEGKCRW